MHEKLILTVLLLQALIVLPSMDSIEGSRKPPLKPILTKNRKVPPIHEEEEPAAAAEGMNKIVVPSFNGFKLDDHGELTEEEHEPLSPSARLFHEPHFNCHILAIMGGKTRIDPEVVKAGLVNTLLKHPRFSSLQVKVGSNGTDMRWVRTEVDVENHVIVPDLDLNMESPDQFVEDYISNLTKTTLDMSKPLWDIHLLNVKTSEAEAVGIIRVHHSLGDGTSLMSLLLACTRQTADPQALPTISTTKRLEPKNSNWFWHIFLAILGVFSLVWNTMVDLLVFVATSMFLQDTETPLKGPPGNALTPKRFAHRTVSLNDMKLVKRAMNMTINDVALGVTSAGLSRYLNRRYADGKSDEGATEMRNNLPKNIRLRATLLVNIRPSHGIQDLADMMEKDNTDAKWGNWLGYVLLPFTIALRDDPLDYLHEAKATIDRKKHSLEALYTFYSSELFLKFFGVKAAASLSHNILTHTTMSFSNVVGPREEISFHGHPIAFIAPTVYGHPHAFTMNFQSYMDKMTIVLAVDETLVPDPHQLLDDLEESLKLIKDAVAKRNSSVV